MHDKGPYLGRGKAAPHDVAGGAVLAEGLVRDAKSSSPARVEEARTQRVAKRRLGGRREQLALDRPPDCRRSRGSADRSPARRRGPDRRRWRIYRRREARRLGETGVQHGRSTRGGPWTCAVERRNDASVGETRRDGSRCRASFLGELPTTRSPFGAPPAGAPIDRFTPLSLTRGGDIGSRGADEVARNATLGARRPRASELA